MFPNLEYREQKVLAESIQKVFYTL